MTEARCGNVSAMTLGLPMSCAIPEEKGILPKRLFAGKDPLSNTLKQHFVRDIASIHLLALLKPANTGLAEGTRIHEIMVLGLKMTAANATVPADVIGHIAAQRPTAGVLFAVTRQGHPTDGTGTQAHATSNATPVEQCALAVHRRLPGKPGHFVQFAVHVGAWQDPADLLLELTGSTLDEAWDSLCSQVLLGTTDPTDLDGRLARRDHLERLRAEEVKLTRDHARAKTPAQRNELFIKLQKLRKELAE